MSRDKGVEVRAGAVSGMGEVGACTDDVGKATLGVAAQFTLVEGVVLCRVCDGAVLAVPSEVPYVAHLPATLGNTPMIQVPDASANRAEVPAHLAGAPRRARELSLVER